LMVDRETEPPAMSVLVAWPQRHWLSRFDSSTLWMRDGAFKSASF
jgi:hypothetical protein